MGKRINELFIGKDFINLEGRTIKHPGLIDHYASVNVNKTYENPLEFIGLDLETNHLTAELKLLGFWNKDEYSYYTKNFLDALFMYIKYATSKGKVFAYWNKLDPFVLYKQFIKDFDTIDLYASLNRFGKIGGEWNYKAKTWEIPPVVEYYDRSTEKYWGIKNVIRSTVEFFIYEKGDDRPKTVWAYDIAQLYEYGLEKEAMSRLSYYSKVDKSAHIVDWERFNADSHYQKEIVLKSNELDARAVYDLALNIQDEFYRAFGYYPKNLISTGSLSRSAIVAVLKAKHIKESASEKEAKKKLLSDINSIGILNFYDQHIKFPGLSDFYSLTCEAYSGGYIEAIRYGYTKEAYYADIASAYPAIIMKLYDLRKSKITTGTGTPPRIENSYCFIRGTVDIPKDINFHPITVKHPTNKDTNIRAVGTYKASYTLRERDFLTDLGATFTDEVWYNVETTGKLSPLAEVAKHFIDLRTELREKGDSAQYMAKIAVNSLYGILFEAVDTYKKEIVTKSVVMNEVNNINYEKRILKDYLHKIDIESIKSDLINHYGADYQKIRSMWSCGKNKGMTPDQVAEEISTQGIYINKLNSADIFIELNELYRMDNKMTERHDIKFEEIYRAGYRAGEFWNPIYAAIITSETRLLLAKNATAIEKAGGKVILMMTDSIFWQGKEDMIISDDVREKKTVGYFEKPTKIYDLVCLGSGRYSFRNELGEAMTSKNRGLNAVDFHDPDGIIIDDFNWYNALKLSNNTDKIKLKVRTLISVGMVLHNKNLDWSDLGKVIEDVREVDLIVGRTKRFYHPDLKKPELLKSNLIETYPIYLGFGMFGTPELNDQTLPLLRKEMMKYKVKSLSERKKESQDKANKKYRSKPKNAKKRNDDLKAKYQQLKAKGYSRSECKNMAHWSIDRITNKLMEDNKL